MPKPATGLPPPVQGSGEGNESPVRSPPVGVALPACTVAADQLCPKTGPCAPKLRLRMLPAELIRKAAGLTRNTSSRAPPLSSASYLVSWLTVNPSSVTRKRPCAGPVELPPPGSTTGAGFEIDCGL